MTLLIASILFTKENKVDIDRTTTLVDYVQNREKFMLRIGNRNILETRWMQRIENAITTTVSVEYTNDLYGQRIKTSSKIINTFCSSYAPLGFIRNPADVFMCICINPLLPKDKIISNWKKTCFLHLK